ncbi:MAG: hypothetical protein LC659_12205 [Myxococcales bacterium]|nr:hypothetical protein [Myxococcales bacterium]
MQRLLLLALLAGCSAPPPGEHAPPNLSPAPVVAGEMTVLTLTDGQDDTLVEGAQGGFHVWMQYAVRSLPAGAYTLERSAHRASDGAVVLVFRGAVDVGAAAADGWWTAPAPIPMFMCPSPIGISVVDVPIDFTLRLLGAGDAELARAAITLVPRCPDAQRDFCTRICTG